MKAILEFNLPEDREEYDACIKGNDYMCNLIDIDNFLRNQLKHGHDFPTPESVMEWVRNKITTVEIW